MKFVDFIKADEDIAMIISVKEYESIKTYLKEIYTEEQFRSIDEFCKHRTLGYRFLLCNPYHIQKSITPILNLYAITYADIVPFQKVEFTVNNKEEPKKHLYYASGKSLVEGRWQSCGWTIEAESFLEAAQIAEADKTFRIHSLSDNVVY